MFNAKEPISRPMRREVRRCLASSAHFEFIQIGDCIGPSTGFGFGTQRRDSTLLRIVAILASCFSSSRFHIPHASTRTTPLASSNNYRLRPRRTARISWTARLTLPPLESAAWPSRYSSIDTRSNTQSCRPLSGSWKPRTVPASARATRRFSPMAEYRAASRRRSQRALVSSARLAIVGIL